MTSLFKRTRGVDFPVLCTTVLVILLIRFTRVSSAGLDLNPSNLDNVKQTSMTAESIKNKTAKNMVILEEMKSSSGKRQPKFGFNMQLPSLPGLTSSTMTTIRPDGTIVSADGSGNNNPYDEGNSFPNGLGLASTAVLIKSGVLGGLTAIKAALIPPLFIGSIIIFLIAGAVFFTCNVINCGSFIGSGSSGGGGGFGPGFGGLPSFNNAFNRNGYDYYEQVQPVYQALDDNYKKFE